MCVHAEKLADVKVGSGDILSRLLKGLLIFSRPSAEGEGGRGNIWNSEEREWYQRAQA